MKRHHYIWQVLLSVESNLLFYFSYLFLLNEQYISVQYIFKALTRGMGYNSGDTGAIRYFACLFSVYCSSLHPFSC